MILHSLYQWASLAVLLIACGLGAWRGGWPERIAAAAMMLAWFATALFLNGTQIIGPQATVMIIDLALFGVLLAIALTSDRWWPLWASAFHGLSVVLGVAMLADPKIWSAAGFIAGNIFSYLTLLALLIGSLLRRTDRSTVTP